jgi:hypothetical protein
VLVWQNITSAQDLPEVGKQTHMEHSPLQTRIDGLEEVAGQAQERDRRSVHGFRLHEALSANGFPTNVGSHALGTLG